MRASRSAFAMVLSRSQAEMRRCSSSMRACSSVRFCASSRPVPSAKRRGALAAFADVQIEHAERREVIAGLEDEHVADPLRLRRLGVHVAGASGRTDDHRGQPGHLVGDALGLAATDRGERDDDADALVVQLRRRLLHRLAARGRGETGERLGGPVLVRRGHADEADLGAAEVLHHRGPVAPRGTDSPGAALAKSSAPPLASSEVRQLRGAADPVVATGGERDEAEPLDRRARWCSPSPCPAPGDRRCGSSSM